MPNALMLETMSSELLTVAERAKREPDGQFHALAHLIDVPALTCAYRRLRKKAAVGVDGITKDDYGQDLEHNLQSLHHRLKTQRYRHQPILRGYVPKGQGQHRPIGISATEDKVVQGALRDVLEAIDETEFLESSYGFRPKRGAQDALRTLDRAGQGGAMNWIVEADIVSYFDSVDRTKLTEMIQKRVADGGVDAAHWQMFACGRAGRRWVFRAGRGHGPRISPFPAPREHLPPFCPRSLGRIRRDATPPGEVHLRPVL